MTQWRADLADSHSSDQTQFFVPAQKKLISQKNFDFSVNQINFLNDPPGLGSDNSNGNQNPPGNPPNQNPPGNPPNQNPPGNPPPNTQTPGQPTSGIQFDKLPNPLGPAGIHDLSSGISKVVDLVMIVALPFIVLAIMYSGFLFIQAQGNGGKLEQARHTFMWTLIGTALLLGSYTIAQAIIVTVQKLGS